MFSNLCQGKWKTSMEKSNWLLMKMRGGTRCYVVNQWVPVRVQGLQQLQRSEPANSRWPSRPPSVVRPRLRHRSASPHSLARLHPQHPSRGQLVLEKSKVGNCTSLLINERMKILSSLIVQTLVQTTNCYYMKGRATFCKRNSILKSKNELFIFKLPSHGSISGSSSTCASTSVA